MGVWRSGKGMARNERKFLTLFERLSLLFMAAYFFDSSYVLILVTCIAANMADETPSGLKEEVPDVSLFSP